jgi:hypothetical protein
MTRLVTGLVASEEVNLAKYVALAYVKLAV